MEYTLALVKVEEKWEAALIVNQKFTRSASGDSVNALVTKLLGPVMSAEQAEGTEMAIRVGILPPEERAKQEAANAGPVQTAS